MIFKSSTSAPEKINIKDEAGAVNEVVATEAFAANEVIAAEVIAPNEEVATEKAAVEEVVAEKAAAEAVTEKAAVEEAATDKVAAEKAEQPVAKAQAEESAASKKSPKSEKKAKGKKDKPLKYYRYDGDGKFSMKNYSSNPHKYKSERAKYEALTAKNIAKMIELQDELYADGKEGVIILFQAMDAAGKDSTIKHVMSGLNPQGVDVYSFKQPSKEELAHDYLWRATQNTPERGHIAIFNRSYYEDVLVVRVHEMYKNYALPKRCTGKSEKKFFEERYRQIADFERYLYENGYRILKIMLNVGLDAQKKRFLERIDDPAKNWKFSSSDLAERALWPKYMEAFEDAISATATKESPWYIIPSDKKWYARYLVSEAVVKTLKACKPQYPDLPKEDKEKLAGYKAQLCAEYGCSDNDASDDKKSN